ncbi:MAG: hypothetical protein ABIJ57_03420 [Pseudomonadota bacterium]
MKKCSGCNEIKPLSEFYADPRRKKDGRGSRCKKCHHIATAKWKAENKGRVRERERERRKENPQKAHGKDRRDRLSNLEKIHERGLLWRKANPERLRVNNRKAKTKKRSTPKGKLNHNVSASMLKALKCMKAGRHWESLAGYTVDQLKKHLETNFLPGMTWGNYGKGWHIDHKIPITAFNFEIPEDIDFKRCWAMKNLQPLWMPDNIRKSGTVDKPLQPSLSLGL